MKHKQINDVPLYTAWILGSVCVCVWGGLAVGLVTRAVTQTHSAYGIFNTEG